MAGEIKIKVASVAGGKLENEAGATVSVVPAADVESLAWPYASVKATHEHRQNGNYECSDPGKEPGVGQWMLIVSKVDMSPVVQRLTITDDGGILIASPGWDNRGKAVNRTAATVSIVPYNRKQGATAAQYSLITVRLFKRKEVVMLASHNYRDNTRYVEFAYGRRNKLYRLGALDAGALATIFVCDDRKVHTMVKDSSPDNKSWLTVASATVDPLSITDFYMHLDARGKNYPGTVREAGVFGHAYYNGPIVWNTSDESDSLTERDSADYDGRTKDWIKDGPTMKTYKDLDKAFTRDAEYRVWGCNHMLNVISECRFANQQHGIGIPRDRLFDMRLDVYRSFEHGSLDHLKRNIGQYVVGKKVRHSLELGDAAGVVAYMGIAAQHLSIPCYGAPPGAGSLYRQTREDGMEGYISRTGESAPVFTFFEREFGADCQTDDLGYLNYSKMQAAALPTSGWSTDRWMRFRDDDIGQNVLRLPSGLELYSTTGNFLNPTAMTLNGTAGHLYAAPGCRPVRVELRGPYRVLILARAAGEDCGVLVLADGQSTLMQKRGNNGPWLLNNNPLEIVTMKLEKYGAWSWVEDSSVPKGTITNSVLETVAPAWYW